MARVLVTEKIAQSGLDLLSRAGHQVDVAEGLSPEELLDAVAGAEALIIRSCHPGDSRGPGGGYSPRRSWAGPVSGSTTWT